MNNKQYESTIARLLSQVDYLETELHYLNRILIEVGFSEGIETLKASVEELMEETKELHPVRRPKT